MTEPTTTELLTAAAAGDEAAWSGLVDRYSRLVWHVIWLVGARGAVAEDIYQTTWLRLVEYRDRIRDPERLAGWLARTARNEATRQGKLAARQRPVDEIDLLGLAPVIDLTAAKEPGHAVAEGDVLTRIWSALERLGDDCRKLLGLLATAPDLTYREVAEVLDRPIGWIGPTRRRCLDKLAAVPEVRSVMEASIE